GATYSYRRGQSAALLVKIKEHRSETVCRNCYIFIFSLRSVASSPFSILKFSALGDFGAHNIILYLKAETMLQKVYGIEKPFKALAIYMDEKDVFVNQLNELSSRT
ncbi:MAG: hypothetical protein AB8G86_03380, partial [Saprospiraceae bacterium]